MGAEKDVKALLIQFLLVLVYCLIGAGIFYAIEHKPEHNEIVRKQQLYNRTRSEIMRRFGLTHADFETMADKLIDARSASVEWTFSRGVDLCWQTITTIGYGNKTPRTLAGQLFLIPYALIGIPLTVLMLNTVGQNISYWLLFLLKRMYGKEEVKNSKLKLFCAASLLTLFLLVIMASVSTKYEEWSFGEGLYVWFVTFTTVGFGDFIPGNKNTNVTILYRCVIVLVGLSLISTIFNVMVDCAVEKRQNAKSKSWLQHLKSLYSSSYEPASGNGEKRVELSVGGMDPT